MAAKEKEVRWYGDSDIEILKWKVRKGSMVSKGSVLALYTDAGNADKSRSVKLKSKDSGLVIQVSAEEGTVLHPGDLLLVIHPQTDVTCTHPTIMKDMCADCGADLRREMGVAGDRKKSVSASVAMVHCIPELIVSQEQAFELGKEDENRLLRQRKLVLLVDLDQTLIHTTNDNIPPNLKGVKHFQLWHGKSYMWYHTKFRPHTQQFLEAVSKMYELHICTFGVRMYAHIIARLLDPDEKYFSHRILSRDECFDPLSKTANLKALFPCGDKMVGIIDDREDVWNRAPNLIHVKPYRFFQGTADINAPQGLTKTEHDNEPISHRLVDHSQQKQGVYSSDVSGKHMKDISISEVGEKGSKDSGKIEKHDNDSKDSDVYEKHDKDDKVSDLGEKHDKDEKVSDVGEKHDNDGNVSGVGEKHEMDSGVLEVDENYESTPNSSHVPVEASSEDADKSNVFDTAKKNSHPDEKRTDAMVSSVAGNDIICTDDKNRGVKCSGDVSDAKGFSQKSPDPENPVSPEKCSESTRNLKAENAGGDIKASSESTIPHSENVTDHRESEDVTSKHGISGASDKAHPIGNGDCKTDGAVSQGDQEEIEWVDEDDYLLHLEEILTRVHKAYYGMYEQSQRNGSSELPDLKNIIPYVMKKTLKGANIVFSGMFPLNMGLEKSRAYIVAKALGANVQQDIVPRKAKNGNNTEATTHLVAAKPGTGKHKTALKTKGIHIVSGDWLWTCNERWEWVDESLFPLVSKDPSSKNMGSPGDSTKKTGKNELKKRKIEELTKKNLDEDISGEKSDSSEIIRKSKKQKLDIQELNKDSEIQPSTSNVSDVPENNFANSFNPLYSFSDEDIEFMDKEVDELMDEDDNSSEESEEEREARIRQEVLGKVVESDSDSDSLSGDFPRGWKLRRKSFSPDKKNEEKETDAGDDDETENELIRYQKNMAAFVEDESGSDSERDEESVGSVDDEIAEAVEKEFLASL